MSQANNLPPQSALEGDLTRHLGEWNTRSLERIRDSPPGPTILRVVKIGNVNSEGTRNEGTLEVNYTLPELYSNSEFMGHISPDGVLNPRWDWHVELATRPAPEPEAPAVGFIEGDLTRHYGWWANSLGARVQVTGMDWGEGKTSPSRLREGHRFATLRGVREDGRPATFYFYDDEVVYLAGHSGEPSILRKEETPPPQRETPAPPQIATLEGDLTRHFGWWTDGTRRYELYEPAYGTDPRPSGARRGRQFLTFRRRDENNAKNVCHLYDDGVMRICTSDSTDFRKEETPAVPVAQPPTSALDLPLQELMGKWTDGTRSLVVTASRGREIRGGQPVLKMNYAERAGGFSNYVGFLYADGTFDAAMNSTYPERLRKAPTPAPQEAAVTTSADPLDNLRGDLSRYFGVWTDGDSNIEIVAVRSDEISESNRRSGHHRVTFYYNTARGERDWGALHEDLVFDPMRSGLGNEFRKVEPVVTPAPRDPAIQEFMQGDLTRHFGTYTDGQRTYALTRMRSRNSSNSAKYEGLRFIEVDCAPVTDLDNVRMGLLYSNGVLWPKDHVTGSEVALRKIEPVPTNPLEGDMTRHLGDWVSPDGQRRITLLSVRSTPTRDSKIFTYSYKGNNRLQGHLEADGRFNPHFDQLPRFIKENTMTPITTELRKTPLKGTKLAVGEAVVIGNAKYTVVVTASGVTLEQVAYPAPKPGETWVWNGNEVLVMDDGRLVNINTGDVAPVVPSEVGQQLTIKAGY